MDYASARMRGDEDVVMAAVTQAGYALKYASEDMRNNKKVVMAAVAQYNKAFVFASAELQADNDVRSLMHIREATNI